MPVRGEPAGATTRPLRWRRPAATAAIVFAIATAAAADPATEPAPITERRVGDLLSYALPAATLGVELARGDGAGAGQFTRSFAATLAATELLKRATGVERPDRSDDLSFPSGHASRAFVAATYVHRRHGIGGALPLYALATYVGHTRVQAGRHRWVDVLGSAVMAAVASRALVERRVDRDHRPVPLLLVSVPLR